MNKKLISCILSMAMLMPCMAIPTVNAEAAENVVSWTEALDRGLVAVPVSGGVYLSWRLFEDEDTRFGSGEENVSFDIYRNGEKIATESNTTNYIDAGGTTASVYAVVPSGGSYDSLVTKINSVEGNTVTVNGAHIGAKVYVAKYSENALDRVEVFNITKLGEQTFTADFEIDKAFIWDGMQPIEPEINGTSLMINGGYITIPLDKPAAVTLADGRTHQYSANDASCGDVDGDGDYEIILKWDCNGQDNSNDGYTGNVYLDAYELDGTKLWRIDLGQNIRGGAHYTQFMVYDFDGDGRAETACKTAPGSKDSSGEYVTKASHVEAIAAVTDEVNETSYVNEGGRILTGAEYYTVFDGSGKAIDTINYPFPRGNVGSWGNNESYGNRVDRFLGAVAYLDGVNPYIISVRGYYGKTTVAAMRLENGQLNVTHTFTTATAGTQYEGQGNHNITVADVDNDGKDEIISGSICWDDDLSLKWCSGRGHGDALHIGDYDPTHEGLEYFSVHESGGYEITGSTTASQGKEADYGMTVYDANTGEELYHQGNSKDTGRGVMANIGSGGYYQITGSATMKAEGEGVFSSTNYGPGSNFRIFWDGDLYDEILDGTTVTNWNGNGISTAFKADGCTQVNGTKANPALQADLFGDWREELVYPTSDSSALRVYTTTEKTDYKMKSLMFDKVYREGVAAEQTAYNQPPHIGYYVSEDSFYGTMTGIELDTANTKTTYYVGEEFDKTGLKVTGKYSDADDRELNSYSVSGYDPMTVGEQTITVKYLSQSATYTVTVVGESGITVENSKTTYKVGEAFDKSALSVKLVYDNNNEADVSSFKISGYDPMLTGMQKVAVNYIGVESTYTEYIYIEVITGLIISGDTVTGYSGDETEVVIPIMHHEITQSSLPREVEGIADGAFADTSLTKICIYSEDISLNGDNIFPEGVTIACIEGSTAHEYALNHNIAVELIETGDSVTFDEDFYAEYAGKNMLMQATSAQTLKDEFVTYNTTASDSRAPWFKADMYGFAVKNDGEDNYLYVNAGITHNWDRSSQIYIQLNTPVSTQETQAVSFDVMFLSNSGAPYIELLNDAETVIDIISASALSLTNDVWYTYELAYDGGYTAVVYDASGAEVSSRTLSVTAGNTILSSIVFKQELEWGSMDSGQTGITNIDNILLKNTVKKEEVKKVVKVMPLGDSITDGFNIAGGYRNTLEAKILADGISENVDFVGSSTTGTGYDKNHEGHSGWAIEAISSSDDIEKKGRKGLATNIDGWMKTYAPDIVMLQIGTNDILSQYKLDEAQTRLENLVDKILAGLADGGKVYIAKIPYISISANYNKTGITDQTVMNGQVDDFNKAVEAVAQAKGLTLVDVNSALTLSDLADGIHPNTTGYEKLGNLWYETIIGELNTRIN